MLAGGFLLTLGAMENTLFLRLALRFNAIFSFVCGTGAIAFDHSLALMLNVPSMAPTLIGAGLVAYSVFLGGLSLSRRVASAWTVFVTVMDFAWVLVSIVFVVLHAMSGVWLVLVTASVVAAYAVLQLAGLRRVVFDHGHGQFEVARDVNAPAERSWSVVADLASYPAFAKSLHKAEIVAGEGLGLVRRCEDTHGVCWLETCVRWEPGKAYAFAVDTSGPEYPLPLSTMRGDFEVEPLSSERSTIRVRFTFSARGGAWTELFLALMFSATGDRFVGGIIKRWAAQIEKPEAKFSAVRLGCTSVR